MKHLIGQVVDFPQHAVSSCFNLLGKEEEIKRGFFLDYSGTYVSVFIKKTSILVVIKTLIYDNNMRSISERVLLRR